MFDRSPIYKLNKFRSNTMKLNFHNCEQNEWVDPNAVVASHITWNRLA